MFLFLMNLHFLILKWFCLKIPDNLIQIMNTTPTLLTGASANFHSYFLTNWHWICLCSFCPCFLITSTFVSGNAHPIREQILAM